MKKKTRVKRYEPYFYIGADLKVYQARDYYIFFDDQMFWCGNYFLTEQEAETYASKFRELLNNK